MSAFNMIDESNFFFSLEIMMSCNGNSSHDGVYMKWFIGKCVSRIEYAANSINNVVMGIEEINVNTSSKMATDIANVRHYMAMLDKLIQWYANKPVIAENFKKAYQSQVGNANTSEKYIIEMLSIFNNPGKY